MAGLCVLLLPWYTWSATMFRFVVFIKLISTWIPEPKVANRTFHFNKMINVILFPCQWFECCGWSVCRLFTVGHFPKPTLCNSDDQWILHSKDLKYCSLCQYLPLWVKVNNVSHELNIDSSVTLTGYITSEYSTNKSQLESDCVNKSHISEFINFLKCNSAWFIQIYTDLRVLD